MRKRPIDIIIFILSLSALVITSVLLMKFGKYEITYNGDRAVMDGGWLRIGINAVILLLLTALSLISGARLFREKRYNIIIFVLSVLTLAVTWMLHSEFGAYEITYNNNSIVVYGGWSMIIMNSARGIILAALTLISGICLFRKVK